MSDHVMLYIFLMAIITYLTRFPMLLLSSRLEMPAFVQRGLRMVPVGVFSSLTLPPIIFHVRDGSWNPEYVVAGIVALGVGFWKKQIFLALLVGVVAIAVWRMIF